MNASSISPVILLSGGSGMLGSAVRQALADRGAGVLQLVRRDPVEAGQVRWIPGASTPVSDPEPLEGLAAAIHLSGASVAAHRWTSAWKREMWLSRVESTRALASTLAALRQPPKTLMVASATGIYGNRGDELLDESSAPGSGFLADLCREWEAAARPAVEAGIRVVHLRFGVVLGPGAGALAKMLPLFRLGLGGRLGSGRQWMSWISLADAGSAILFSMDTPSLAGPLNLIAPQPVTNAEFTRALGKAVHRPAVLPAPAFALRLALGAMANEALLASARVVPAKLGDAGFQFIHPTVDRALAAALAPRR
ncbi:MAG TPA: TIGR01777 family oxidoreductase [Terracidiphilus sp.]|nr:TIGR01777 family oxidoreductase [Terracidiphilus sp.]